MLLRGVVASERVVHGSIERERERAVLRMSMIARVRVSRKCGKRRRKVDPSPTLKMCKQRWLRISPARFISPLSLLLVSSFALRLCPLLPLPLPQNHVHQTLNPDHPDPQVRGQLDQGLPAPASRNAPSSPAIRTAAKGIPLRSTFMSIQESPATQKPLITPGGPWILMDMVSTAFDLSAVLR